MVILQVNKFFYEKGGTERYFFLLSEELEKRGHRVVHFSMAHPKNRPSPYSQYFVTQKNYDERAGTWGTLARGVSFVRSREAAKNIRRLLAEHKPAVAHLHNVYHQITPSIIPELNAAGVPVVMTLHDYKLICPNYSLFAKGAYCYRCKGGRFHNAALTRCSGGSFPKSLLLSIESYWQRFSGVYKSVRRFIAPSRYIRDAFVGAGYDDARVTYLPGFVPPGENTDELTEAERRLIDTLPETYLLYFGRLSPEKGLMTLLEATGTEDMAGVPVVLCGEGPEEQTFRRYCKRRDRTDVYFTGYLNKAVLDRIVRSARAVVMPTISPENAPYTVLESAAAGVPVIVSDMGGLPEMVEVLGGWVFRHGDSADLARVIREVWPDPAMTKTTGRESREAAAQHFGPPKHMDALERIYKEVLAGG